MVLNTKVSSAAVDKTPDFHTDQVPIGTNKEIIMTKIGMTTETRIITKDEEVDTKTTDAEDMDMTRQIIRIEAIEVIIKVVEEEIISPV